MQHLLQLQQLSKEIEALGIRAAAISVEPVRGKGGAVAGQELRYPLLSDAKLTVSDAYRVTAKGEGFSRPAVFLIDPEGRIRFGRVGVPHGPFDAQALENAVALVREGKR
ncbi:MAG: peroxiredoxin family protein [Armatimonadetes bacterium]|nr:peroxiredoxin family protein [Armatimonadota bacterium]